MEAYNPHVEVVEYRGLRLVIRQTPLDWLVFITLSGGSGSLWQERIERALWHEQQLGLTGTCQATPRI
jgi:hypothetical protein